MIGCLSMKQNNLFSKNLIFIAILLKYSVPFCEAADESSFKKLLKPVDPYAVPAEVKKTVKKEEIFNKVIEDNLQIQQSRLDVSLADLAYTADLSALYPQLTLNASGTSGSAESTTTNPPLTPDEEPSTVTSKTINKGAALGLAIGGDSDWGFNYSLDLPKISETDSYTEDAITRSANLTVGANLGIHLLKDNVFLIGNSKRKTAKLTYDSARENFRQTLIAALFSTENFYFTVFQQQAQLQIVNYTFAATKALLSDTQELYKQGEIAQFELVQVELQVAQTEAQLVAAKQDYKNALEDLRDAVNSKEIIYPDPNEIKKIPEFGELPFDRFVAIAKEKRSDYRLAKWQQENNMLALNSAKSATLPTLDLAFQIQKDRLETNLPAVMKKPNQLRNPQKSVTLTLTYKLFDYGAEKNYVSAKNQTKKDQISFEILENKIKHDVLLAIASVQSSKEKLKLSIKSKALALAKLKAEFDRYRLGESSIKNIIDFQNQQNAAELDELSSRIALYRAISNLRLVQGLPPQTGIDL